MTSPDPVALFGCKSTTRFLLDALLDRGLGVTLVTIAPAKGAEQEVADYTDLRAYGAGRGVDVYVAERYSLRSDRDRAFFRDRSFALGFVIGWQRLVPAEVLATFSTGVFGMHGSAMGLPRGRGRSPMNWSLIEGRRSFRTHLFRYAPGADDGDLLDGHTFAITDRDTAETLHFKNTLAMKMLVERNLPALLAGTARPVPQPQGTPTYYPKRFPADSLIDWHDDLHAIDRHIRAVAPPFNGAYTYLHGTRLSILRAAPFSTDDFGYSATPGTVVTVFPGGKFLVQCFGGLLLVHAYSPATPPDPGMLLTTGPEALRRFPRNAQGYFDLP